MPFKLPFGIKSKRPAPSPGNPTPVTLVSHEGFKNKIILIKHTRTHAGLGLRDAMELLDRFLAGEQVTFNYLSEDDALYFIDAAAQLGVHAQHADNAS